MRRYPTSTVFSLALAAWLFAPSLSQATTYVRLADADLAQQSPVIVSGRIVAIEAAELGELPAIDYRFDVDRVVKGSAVAKGDRLRIRLPGGVRADGIGLKIFGMPSFGRGQEVIFFLRRQPGGVYSPQQLMLGAFTLDNSSAGKMARRHLDGAVEWLPDGAKAVTERPRDAAKFLDWLSDLTAGHLRPPDYLLEPSAALAEAKFVLSVSSTEPLPVGCGENGGHPIRWFSFAEQSATYFRSTTGLAGLEEGGSAELRTALKT